ncbi:hypothetical protein TNCV_3822731 [Trichonephila clavipes]|nr:hypothetical protein TNCV_3822731 [Trichonephila clavipes]
MIVCPRNCPLSPCEIVVCRSTINAGSDRWPVRLNCAGGQTETESGFITEDDTSPVCNKVARGRHVDTAYDVGSVLRRLVGRRLLKPTSVIDLLMVSLDDTGCLEGEVSGVESISDVVGAEVAISDCDHAFVFLGR